MSKYIDSEKLIAEIERLKERAQAERVLHPKTILSAKNYLLIQDYDAILSFVASLQQEQPEVELFECPKTPIKDAIEVTSRMKYIDEELKPIAEFIMDYASWNLHKDEWNQPVIEVPLFRVLDALVLMGKPYCCTN